MKVIPTTMFSRDWNFSEETFKEVCSRYSGFGIQLYGMIRDHMPATFNHLRFYRSVHIQAGDSFAICEIDYPFSIQLDPDIEVIVLSGENTHTEIGTWVTNPCEEAINFIRQHFIKPDGEQVSAHQSTTAP